MTLRRRSRYGPRPRRLPGSRSLRGSRHVPAERPPTFPLGDPLFGTPRISWPTVALFVAGLAVWALAIVGAESGYFGYTVTIPVQVFALASVLTSCETVVPPFASNDFTSFERDRQAILAMTGEYEVTFDFRETVALAPGYEKRKPYRSAGYERIDVAADEGRRIVLHHVLVTAKGY